MNVNIERSVPISLQVEKRKSRRYIRVFTGITLLAVVLSSIVSLIGYQTYRRDSSLAQTAIRHLQNAKILMKTLSLNPFDTQAVNQAQHEFSMALTSLEPVNRDIKSLPPFRTSIPLNGTQLGAAVHLVPLAIAMSQVGVEGCKTLKRQ